MKAKTAQAKPVKPLSFKTGDTQSMGPETVWSTQPAADVRKVSQLAQFAWYNYYCDVKEAKQFTIDWMSRNSFSADDCRRMARATDRSFPTPLGWLCRMNMMGWEFDQRDKTYVTERIAQLCLSAQPEAEVTESAAVAKPNIQDHLREKMRAAGGEIEGMFDSMITAGAKMNADFKPMSVLRAVNVAPQLVGEIADHWQGVAEELSLAAAGKDADLTEGYRSYSKIQLRNMIKFAEQVSADCASYVQVKKVERKPRKKKPVSPEKLTAKFKYLREFPELGLKSVPVTELVNAQEAWLYDTKRRKLIHVQPEAVVGSFSVKGSSLIGFDPTQSVRKTLRKPAEQIKALLAAGAPAARKIFKDIKSAETKFNGRGNADIIILRVR